MENRAIANLLYETADLMEVAGEDSFRIRSYRNAAGVIEGHPESIASILKNPERKVTDISGIGKGIAAILQEIEQRGSFERRDEMLEKYPASALELLKIQGLGPKGIRVLFEQLHITSIDTLETACREQKIRETPVPRGANKAPEALKPAAKFATLADAVSAFLAARERSVEYAKSTTDDLRSHFAPHGVLGAI